MRELRDSNREITTAHSKDSDKASKKKKSQLKSNKKDESLLSNVSPITE